MSGWLAVWARAGAEIDPATWARAVRSGCRYEEAAVERATLQGRLAAWRRTAGEFPRSGTLIGGAGATVAWLGQCVDDHGDATDAAIRVLGSPTPEPAAAAALNGPFACAVLRETPFSVTIWTDRYRHYPVYLHRAGAVTIASTEIRCIVPWIRSPRLARDSADLMLRCGELIDRMTMLEGVEFVPAGTVISDDDRSLRERPYWTLRHRGEDTRSMAAVADDLAARLRTSVRRIETASERLSVTLSGGLDSRLLLGLCRDPATVPSFTWGEPGCRDIACARAFARRVGSPHQVRHWDPGAFVPLWARGVDATAGGFGVESMYMLPFTGLLQQHSTATLNGLAGDAILGGNFLKLSWLRQKSLLALAHQSWEWRVPPEHDARANALMGAAAGADPGRQRWVASITADPGAGPIERLNDWLYVNRVFRNTNCGTMLLRTAVESHAPFFDLDVADALFRTPLWLKFKHRLYLRVLARACPDAAAVPWQRTALPPAWGVLANVASMAAHRAATLALRPTGIKPFKSLPVADPAGWFRGPWRLPAEHIILGDRALGRGLLSPEAVRSVWNAHQAGANFTRQLGVLVAIELFSRQVIDGELPQALAA